MEVKTIKALVRSTYRPGVKHIVAGAILRLNTNGLGNGKPKLAQRSVWMSVGCELDIHVI